MNVASQTEDQFISIYFFGSLSSFPNMMARTIAKAEETANRNIKTYLVQRHAIPRSYPPI